MASDQMRSSRLFWECLVIVAGILIAFAIDAWWEESEEQRDTDNLLGAFVVELQGNVETVRSRLKFRQAKKKSISELLESSRLVSDPGAVGKINALLSDLVYWGITNFDEGASRSLVQSGSLAWIEDDALRAKVVGWPDEYLDINRIERQEYDRVQSVLMPILISRSNYSAIHNASRGRPGDPDFLPPFDTKISSVDSRSNWDLITQPDFQSVLVVLLEDQGDVILFQKRFVDRAEELAGDIQHYLKK